MNENKPLFHLVPPAPRPPRKITGHPRYEDRPRTELIGLRPERPSKSERLSLN